MESTAFALERTESCGSHREIVVYNQGAQGMHLMAETNEEGGLINRVEIFFWTGPADGDGRRRQVATVGLDRRRVSMSGPSWRMDDLDESKDYRGALEVAQAWFAFLLAVSSDNRKQGASYATA